MPRGPFEWMYELQSRPLKAYVLDEVAAHLAQAVTEFPPRIEEWEDLQQRDRFEPVLRLIQGRPGDGPVRLALRLLRWEIERDYEAIDRCVTGAEAEELAPHGLQRELAIFLWQFWLDQTLAFKEFAKGKFTRAELAGLVDRLESQLLGGSLRVQP